MLDNVQFQQPELYRCRYDDDIDDMVEYNLGLSTNDPNNFDKYLNKATKNIKDRLGKSQLLEWWKNSENLFQDFSGWSMMF